ncbi:nucleoside-diphosphate-sugar epimerase [Bradyrhizobium elkanii USDA 61]|uniref:Nucleoside-diphosphate-sugar epimerase n=1 Tax=Bradyrhizobium elkanii TaxID=29448 RepID=A0A8I1Y8Z5_BRAEL|nr:FAD-dependent oxidoreductase [Bradyrhizobium elkanii]MCS4011372.1 nucleoside-diphosphate-sugar epimerase [Bradyrhizobium elkanii USDA 61]MBP1294450.1 nucleoside-diphosphate-sugar epimerase [Bradyrhizobium elkanii]MCP1925162.1 nucleoside-diphosphate-sugar epimerase [Bradyrhizobium elkanii]MCS3477349.1 nucleoside-diphosphate-sugar epimerase [Bradyrhizobium elkanii]MCS3584084.1 nucleoside-diphosphate-sugar epimerase [Bradyrhizobium elkanii]
MLIIGAGITGALMAERLTRQGRQVVIIDRELPSLGSTVASTAMLLWEIDRPLFELAQLYGFEKAVRCYRASHHAATCRPWFGSMELPARCDGVSRSISSSMTVRTLFRMNVR